MLNSPWLRVVAQSSCFRRIISPWTIWLTLVTSGCHSMGSFLADLPTSRLSHLVRLELEGLPRAPLATIPFPFLCCLRSRQPISHSPPALEQLTMSRSGRRLSQRSSTLPCVRASPFPRKLRHCPPHPTTFVSVKSSTGTSLPQ